MKNKLLVLNLCFGILVVGCSESAYTPTPNTMPNYGNAGLQYPPSSTIPFDYNSSYQPGMNNPMMNQQGITFQQQGMLGLSARLSLPGFYYNNYQYRSCIPQKPYTTSCSQQIVRPSCTSVVTTRTTGGDDTTKVLPISWVKEDAKALYQRLAKEEDVLKDASLFSKGVKSHTGENYKCIVDGSEDNAKNFVCDLEIRIKDGILLQQTPVGKDGQPEVASSTAYKGDLLNIGVTGEAPETGHLTVAGPSAKYLFQSIAGDGAQGKVEEAGILEAKIKTLGQIKCYQSLNTTNIVTECLIKIDTSKGKALNF